MFHFFNTRKLKTAELEALNATLENLSSGARWILQHQIASITKVQRFSMGKEVNLYGNKNPLAASTDNGFNSDQFINQMPESRLAHIKFKTLSKGVPLSANIWLVYGHLFSIVFSAPPSDVSPQSYEVKSTTILLDPMLPALTLAPDKLRAANSFLGSFFPTHEVRRCDPPCPNPMLQEILATFNIVVPDDYIELLNSVGGCEFNGWRVHGALSLREVVTDVANFVVIAEHTSGSMIVVMEGKRTLMFYLLDIEGGASELVGDVFRDVMLSFFAMR